MLELDILGYALKLKPFRHGWNVALMHWDLDSLRWKPIPKFWKDWNVIHSAVFVLWGGRIRPITIWKQWENF